MKFNKLIPNFIAKFLLFPIATSCFCYSCVSAMDKCSDNCYPELDNDINSSSDIKNNTPKYKDALEYAMDKVISRTLNYSQPLLAKKDSIAGGNLLLAVHASKGQCLKFKEMIIKFLNDSTNLLGTEYDNSHFQNAIQLLRSDKDNLLLKKYISDLFIEQ